MKTTDTNFLSSLFKGGFRLFDSRREPSQSPWPRNQRMLVPSSRLMQFGTTDQPGSAVAALEAPADRGTESEPGKRKGERSNFLKK
ncbi:hypothetical protein TIFTF001_000994 [Ficus carica]|uniref:Uncharacterized protein n=1 Tax=Ficus carica TaxID=3494 RepID=A0AA88D377_FICCA|nr:hypothetical protein TIFTF001_000994 [Ficus carica]